MEGLKANTEYSFSLAAISNKGIGAFTNELVQRTSQASTSQFEWAHILYLQAHIHTNPTNFSCIMFQSCTQISCKYFVFSTHTHTLTHTPSSILSPAPDLVKPGNYVYISRLSTHLSKPPPIHPSMFDRACLPPFSLLLSYTAKTS